MKKIVLWTVILDAEYTTWQWIFTFKPTLIDLLAIVEEPAQTSAPRPLLALVRQAQGTDPDIHDSGTLAYHAGGGVIFIHQSEAFTKCAGCGGPMFREGLSPAGGQ
jgi:hypothetical protein